MAHGRVMAVARASSNYAYDVSKGLVFWNLLTVTELSVFPLGSRSANGFVTRNVRGPQECAVWFPVAFPSVFDGEALFQLRKENGSYHQ